MFTREMSSPIFIRTVFDLIGFAGEYYYTGSPWTSYKFKAEIFIPLLRSNCTVLFSIDGVRRPNKPDGFFRKFRKDQ